MSVSNSITSGPTPVIRLKRVGRHHPQSSTSRWLIRHVTLDVFAGEQVAIFGASGAGKTVLLRIIAGLDPPDEGQLYWNGNSILDRQMPSYRSQVMYLHQHPFFIEGTVRENLLLPQQFATHRPRSHGLEYSKRQLDRFGRGGAFLQQDVQGLSGGEAQLVALVRAIQLRPQVLLLDEPTASADDGMTHHLESLITQWQKEDSRRAYIVVSHQRRQIERLATRALSMDDLVEEA